MLAAESSPEQRRQASHWKRIREDVIECRLCPRLCNVADMERGYCGVRENRDGTYYTLVHSHPCTVNADPIEKKPLFHFLPGTKALSLATAGCNMLCKFCQNWEISQSRPEQLPRMQLPPEKLIALSRQTGCRSIAFTYSEPIIAYEYILDTAAQKERPDVSVIIISNGFINPEPFQELLPHLQSVKIDLKGFTETFYQTYCDGRLRPVLDTLVALRKSNVWFEIVTLLISGLNDSEKEITEMTRWLKEHVGCDVPVHFTRFHPTFQMKDHPPTQIRSIERACEIARVAGLKFVYTGNVPGHPGETTLCPQCKTSLIQRYGHFVKSNRIINGKCPDCGTTIPGRWEKV